MDAMIFAAGLGTRLRPLTDRIPKPLIPVADVPMLERVARRLIAAGADRLIINTSHLAEQIERFVAEREGFGVDVRLSHEPGEPLDTGGALWHARAHFRADAPFFLHNGDVLTDLSLERMYAAHLESGALATLAVLPPAPERYLLFDDRGLCGLARRDTGEEELARATAGAVRRFEFAGVHVVSPEIFGLITERGAFSILWTYLRLARDAAAIVPFSAEGARWVDIGSMEGLRIAEAMFA
jgi:NDP-sugar pyrophosphorylase family protein